MTIFRLGTVNVNSLMNKVNFIADLLFHYDISVLGICETWLVDSCPSSFVEVRGFELFRGDVIGTIRKHGTAIYVKKDLKPVPFNVGIPNLAVVFLPTLVLYIISIYRPPSYNEEQNLQLRLFLLEFCLDKEVVILGDFNLPSLKWSCPNPISGYVSPVDMSCFDTFSLLGLDQLVSEATFALSSNIIDLVLVSEKESVVHVFLLPPLPGCHHSPVICDYSWAGARVMNDEVSFRRLWHKGRYDEISACLNLIDWDSVFLGCGVDSCCDKFYDILNSLVDQFVPLQNDSEKSLSGPLRPPRALMRERTSLWNQFKALRSDLGRHHSSTLDMYDRFQSANYRLRNFSRLKQRDHERNLLAELHTMPKLFHSYIRRKKKGRAPIGPLRSSSNEVITCPSAISEALADKFGENSSIDDFSQVSNHQIFEGVLGCPIITYEQVRLLLCNLDSSSSAGPDNVHPQLLKSCAASLAYPLQLIFSLVITQGTFPMKWREAIIVPLFKSGSRCSPSNYRPISLTSVCSKSLERILSQHIVTYLNDNSILSNQQYGFRSGMSTEDQLILTYGTICKCVDSGGMVDMIFLDFSKAFDLVSHRLLLQKLSALGFDSHFLSLLESFLLDRCFAVSVGGVLSSRRSVGSGVPQGSVLGPLLFLIYVNFVMNGISSSWVAFADDFKVWIGTDGRNGGGEREVLQADLDHIQRVSSSWQLRLNTRKCVGMHFGRGPVNNYCIDGIPLEKVDSYRDLGVMVDSSLKFHMHVRGVVGRAGAMMSELLRSTVCRDRDFMVTLFTSHIRPILEYCSSVFNVGYMGDMRLLESVQRRWTREVDGMGEMEYGDRLRSLSLYSVYGRFLRQDIIKVYKILNGENDQLRSMFERSRVDRTRGHRFKLVLPRCRSELFRRSFFVRTVSHWNKLPEVVVESDSLCSFKRGLDNYLGTKIGPEYLYYFI